MVELLDGILFCGECKMPMLSDGKGFYRHIIDLPRKRLRELLCDAQVAGRVFDWLCSRVFDWLCSIEVACPCCGPKLNPFKDIPKEKAVKYLGTSRGAKDLFLTLRDLFHQPLGHPSELKVKDVLVEAERIIKGKG